MLKLHSHCKKHVYVTFDSVNVCHGRTRKGLLKEKFTAWLILVFDSRSQSRSWRAGPWCLSPCLEFRGLFFQGGGPVADLTPRLTEEKSTPSSPIRLSASTTRSLFSYPLRIKPSSPAFQILTFSFELRQSLHSFHVGAKTDNSPTAIKNITAMENYQYIDNRLQIYQKGVPDLSISLHLKPGLRE